MSKQSNELPIRSFNKKALAFCESLRVVSCNPSTNDTENVELKDVFAEIKNEFNSQNNNAQFIINNILSKYASNYKKIYWWEGIYSFSYKILDDHIQCYMYDIDESDCGHAQSTTIDIYIDRIVIKYDDTPYWCYQQGLKSGRYQPFDEEHFEKIIYFNNDVNKNPEELWNSIPDEIRKTLIEYGDC